MMAVGRHAGHNRSPPGARRLATEPGNTFVHMRAVVLTDTGGPDVLRVQEWPDPQVGPGDVRIAVRAAGLNFADTMARTGFYPNAPKPPCVLGYEVAGEVETVGPDVQDVWVGQ